MAENETKRLSVKCVPDDAPIVGVGKRPQTHLVQKSNALYELCRSNLSLSELKIVDLYLSRINSRDPAHRTVRLEKGEIEKLLGVKKINKRSLIARLKHLGIMVPVDDPSSCDGFRLISIFEEAHCYRDADNDCWVVELTCSSTAKKYLFEIESSGYYSYRAADALQLKSIYAYRLLNYLELNRHKHLTWTITVDDLRSVLGVSVNSYHDYHGLAVNVLTPAVHELNAKTDCRVEINPVRKGRTVKALHITLDSRAKKKSADPGIIKTTPPSYRQRMQRNSQIEESISGDTAIPPMPPMPKGADEKYLDDEVTSLEEAVNHEFDVLQMNQIYTLLKSFRPELLSMYCGDDRSKRYAYLKEAYADLNTYDVQSFSALGVHLKSRFNYLIKIIDTYRNKPSNPSISAVIKGR